METRLKGLGSLIRGLEPRSANAGLMESTELTVGKLTLDLKAPILLQKTTHPILDLPVSCHFLVITTGGLDMRITDRILRSNVRQSTPSSLMFLLSSHTKTRTIRA